VIVRIITYERSTLVNDEKYIGLDVHQATISVAVMNATGKVVMESILETKAATNPGARHQISVQLPGAGCRGNLPAFRSREKYFLDIPFYRKCTRFVRPSSTGNSMAEAQATWFLNLPKPCGFY
jgi:hypothetical protein